MFWYIYDSFIMDSKTFILWYICWWMSRVKRSTESKLQQVPRSNRTIWQIWHRNVHFKCFRQTSNLISFLLGIFSVEFCQHPHWLKYLLCGYVKYFVYSRIFWEILFMSWFSFWMKIQLIFCQNNWFYTINQKDVIWQFLLPQRLGASWKHYTIWGIIQPIYNFWLNYKNLKWTEDFCLNA